MEAAERQSLRCVWVAGGRALTEQEAAVAIVSEARLLLQEDLAQLGVQWDPTTLPPGAPVVGGHSRESDTSAASYLSPHEEQTDSIKDHREADGVKTRVSHDTGDRRGKENKAEYRHKNEREARWEPGKPRSEDGVKSRNHDGNRKADKTEPVSEHTLTEVHAEPCKEPKTDEPSGKLTRANDDDPGEKRERGKQTKSNQEGGEDKGLVSVRAERQQTNRPVPERSLTQELAEILSSPLPQPAPPLQPSSSPMPPPRFRAPICQAEEQHRAPPITSAGAGLVASPAQPGRLKHSRVLSKVLHSIQADKGLQDNIQSPQSKPTGASVVQGPAPAGQQPSADHPSDPVCEMPARFSAPAHVDVETSPLSVSPVSVPPEAKRRRTDSREIDRFSSPELYVGNELDEDAEGAATKAGESFGDSFELDTQTERIIVQQISQHRDGHNRGGNQPVDPDQLREGYTVTAAAELDFNEGSNQLKSPENACPKFNISLTDSQMELILNTSQQVSSHKHDVLIINIKHK